MKTTQYKHNILELFSAVHGIEGDVIEVGIFTGDTSEILLEEIARQALDKHYFGLDTFRGYIEEDLIGANQASKENQKHRRWASNKEEVEERLSAYKNISNLYEGDSKDVIPDLIKNNTLKKLSFIYVDCNLYPPSLKAMEDLYPLLSEGGIMAIDEHLVGGETKAIKEFAEKNNIYLHYFSNTPGPSYYLIKT